MARTYLAVNKKGIIGERAIKGGKNLKENYVKVARSKGRNVYAKRESAYAGKGRENIRSSKRRFKLISFITEGGGGGAPKLKPPPKEELVEVVGIGGVDYSSVKGDFHAEILFTWRGPADFDAFRLCYGAGEVLIGALQNVDRINESLLAKCEIRQSSNPPFRFGVERSTPYSGSEFNSMDYQAYLPMVGRKSVYSGRVQIDGQGR
jgi:hypothetical protein